MTTQCALLLALAIVRIGSTSAWPNLEIESREYKVILTTSPFQGNETTISEALSQLKADLYDTAVKVGAKAYGEFKTKVGTPRYVRYYDVPDCKLRSSGYVLSLRRKIKRNTNSGEKGDRMTTEPAAWEGTLKARSGDRYYTTYKSRDMDSCCKKCVDLGSKLEEDLTIIWSSLYSYSKRCRIADEKQFKTLGDVVYHWKDMDNVIESEMGWDMEDSLSVVSGLTVIEHVYDGFLINFDDGDKDDLGKFSVTVWYNEIDEYFLEDPILVELSFRIKSTGKKLEDWKANTIMKAHAFWEECAHLSWIDFPSATKTARVYEYDPEWCMDEESHFSDADR